MRACSADDQLPGRSRDEQTSRRSRHD